ncbi:hypothetical protein BsWGS_17015 [Bradybaena similaris]
MTSKSDLSAGKPTKSMFKCLRCQQKRTRQEEAESQAAQPADRFTTFGTFVEPRVGMKSYKPGAEELLPESWGQEAPQPADRFTTFGKFKDPSVGMKSYKPGAEELLPESWGQEAPQPADRFTTFGKFKDPSVGMKSYKPGAEELLPESWGNESQRKKGKVSFCKLMKLSKVKNLFKDAARAEFRQTQQYASSRD